ncbi:MAG TPA: antitoxin VbhA family protein [Candidatus Saccharimonadales bacterium]
MINSKNRQSEQRRQASASALASVRAEGLRPSNSVQQRLRRYAEGKISASQLRRETLKDVRTRIK